MSNTYEIRADWDRDTIVTYQAYSSAIADPALKAQRFVSPFSFTRMTWIKPSFLWLMHRSNWGQKRSQERILKVRMKRAGWDKALSLGVLTHPEPAIHGSRDAWSVAFGSSPVHVQWDTERSLRGAALDHYSIQVGLSRHIITEFVEEWTASIEDITPTVNKMHRLLKAGRDKEAKRLLPKERACPLDSKVGCNLLIGKNK